MTIQEILGRHIADVCMHGDIECRCGEQCDLPEDHRAHLADVLDKHMQEREAAAVRETSRYLQRIFPRKGLVNRADILADIEIAADRLGRGIHANGREKKQS